MGCNCQWRSRRRGCTIRRTICPPAPKTAKQLAAKRNQERVKSILLLSILDEYLLKFHNVPDAKSLWAAIKSRSSDEEPHQQMYSPKQIVITIPLLYQYDPILTQRAEHDTHRDFKS
ncbi:hypothetical protein Tco_0855023 [Tanacetum coccineum]